MTPVYALPGSIVKIMHQTLAQIASLEIQLANHVYAQSLGFALEWKLDFLLSKMRLIALIGASSRKGANGTLTIYQLSFVC